MPLPSSFLGFMRQGFLFFCYCIILILALPISSHAQRFLTDMMDTSTALGRGIYPLYQKHDRLRFGGYMQPQFQWANQKGLQNFSGGDFSPNSNNRFTLRRGHVRIDYGHFTEDGKPLALMVFQFDGSERGVFIRDFFGRLYENKWEMLSLTMGMFARPMGFEVNLSSAERESPERGRMSQILMRTERDLGAMITIETRKKNAAIKMLKFDLGIFNGQGLSGSTDYDSHKDLIGRLALKPYKISKKGLLLSGGISGYWGGIVSQNTVRYFMVENGSTSNWFKDSASGNMGLVAPRKYIGGDLQLKIPNRWGNTELRFEYMRGLQTATATTSETPGIYPQAVGTNNPIPLFTRPFAGAYCYFLQNLGSNNILFALKYDWYDPNTKAKGKQIDPANGFSAADIRYDTFGGGLIYNFNSHVKSTLWYEQIHNETTNIPGFTTDLNSQVLTLRVQYRF